MPTKKHKKVRRYRFRIFHFNPKDKRLEATEKCTTKPVVEKEFKRILSERLAMYDAGSFCWELLK